MDSCDISGFHWFDGLFKTAGQEKSPRAIKSSQGCEKELTELEDRLRKAEMNHKQVEEKTKKRLKVFEETRRLYTARASYNGLFIQKPPESKAFLSQRLSGARSENPNTAEQDRGSCAFDESDDQRNGRLRRLEDKLREAKLNQERVMEESARIIKASERDILRCMATIGRLQKELAGPSRRRAEWRACLRRLVESGDTRTWQAVNKLREKLGPKFTQDVVYQRHVAKCEKGLYLTERVISLAEEELRRNGVSDISAGVLGELCGYMRDNLHALQALAGKIQAVGLLTSVDSKELQDYAGSVECLEARCGEFTRHLEDTGALPPSQIRG